MIHGIVRLPGKNYASGLTTRSGNPDVIQAVEQHTRYRSALSNAGVHLTILEADERFPDGTFVEDTAIILDECAIIGYAGHPSRRGEEESIERLLAPERVLEYLGPPGHLDGGDVRRVGRHCYIGKSRRSNHEGIEQFQAISRRYGYTSSVIPVETVLHLSTGASYIGNNTIVSIPELAEKIKRPGIDILTVGNDELYAANCLPVNGSLIMPEGFPRLRDTLVKRGYHIVPTPMSEFEKMDGSLTCLSLLFKTSS